MDVTDEDGVRYVTFTRPDVKNAMTMETGAKLAAAVGAVGAADWDAVVLTGEGDAFSAGGDIEAMAEREESAAEAYDRVTATLGAVAEELLSAPVPVVAKVNGDAVGAGLAVVLACDFAYAVESARFGASFVNVGLVPDMGATVTLPRIVGLRTAKELAFTGRLVESAEAEDLDLVNETVPDDDLDDRVDEVLETLAGQPTANVGMAKRAIHENLGRGWRDGLDYEAHVQALAYSTDAHREGVQAFLDGRRPDFS